MVRGVLMDFAVAIGIVQEGAMVLPLFVPDAAGSVEAADDKDDDGHIDHAEPAMHRPEPRR